MGGIYVFTLANVPVWISPWYLLIVYLFARHADSPASMFAVAVAMTISLLGHEFGHALMARRLNLNPRVLLHGWGGLCMHDRAQRDRDDALIVAAGPFSGLTMAALTWGYLQLAGDPRHEAMATFMSSMLLFNLIWSIFNLLPLWPMDGGQLFRLGMLRLFAPARAEKVTHVTALVVLGGLAYFLSTSFGPFMLIILGLMAFQNIRALREGSDTPVRRESKLAQELLVQAEQAFEQGQDAEAVRLCHQLRAESNVSEKVLGRAWQILGVATTRQGDFREALSYLKRAPLNREVVEALAQCLYQLDMIPELRTLTEGPAFKKLPGDLQQQVLEALAEEEGAPA